MERNSDNWKKYPLLVMGDLPGSLPDSISLGTAEIGRDAALKLNDFYIILATPMAELPPLISQLEQAGATPEQILVVLPAEQAFSHPRLPYLGTIDRIEGENGDEFRNRVLNRLEAQRQKKLLFLLQAVADSGIARRLSESELMQLLDSTRIAHALACSYGLPPRQHESVLRACLRGATVPNALWTNEITLEQLIVETALLVYESATKGTSIRELIRERAAALPFKMRSDLLHQLENCLGSLVGVKSNAA